MAPQETNVIVGNKRSSQIPDLFTFPVPKKRKKYRKRKSTGDPDTSNSQPENSRSDIEIVTLDSDDSHKSEKSDEDDIVLLETPIPKIDLSYPETGSNEACGSEENNIVGISDTEFNTKDARNLIERHIIITSDSESDTIDSRDFIGNNDIVITSDSECDSQNIVLNISGIHQSETDAPNTLNSVSSKILESGPVYRPTVVPDYPKRWTKEMIDYYTTPCEEKRNFDYVEILKTIKSKPSDWYINAADKYGTPKQRRKFVPCRKCQKTGHTEKECRKNIVCYICGQFNHQYPRCPNTVCLSCGIPTPKNIHSCGNCKQSRSAKQSCAICGQAYHSEKLCPSKWRQHLILSNSSIPAKPNPRKFCYNCAAKGHFGFECPRAPYSNYPPENPIITSLLSGGALSNGAADDGTWKNAVIYLYQDTADQLNAEPGNEFLRQFADKYSVSLQLFRSPRDYVKIAGRRAEINLFRLQLNQWKREVAGTADRQARRSFGCEMATSIVVSPRE